MPAGSLLLLPATTVAKKTSGVQVAADDVCCIFYDMKVRKCSTPEETKQIKKAVTFCLSADKKCIAKEGKESLVGDVGETLTDPFKHFVGMLPEKDCSYPLYEASFEIKEFRKEELICVCVCVWHQS